MANVVPRMLEDFVAGLLGESGEWQPSTYAATFEHLKQDPRFLPFESLLAAENALRDAGSNNLLAFFESPRGVQVCWIDHTGQMQSPRLCEIAALPTPQWKIVALMRV